MQCFIGGRRFGKTHQLICLSHDTGYPIVTRSAEMVKAIEYQATKMGKSIPEPICYTSREMLVGAPLRRNVLIDEVGGILEEILGVHIVAAAIDGEALQLANPAISPAISGAYCYSDKNTDQSNNESPSTSDDSLNDCLTNEVMASGCDKKSSRELNNLGFFGAFRAPYTISDRLIRFLARCSGRYD